METKNTLIKLGLVYRIGFDDVCGFRFWANFLAVLRFWTIFSSVLRFLIHPNAPLLVASGLRIVDLGVTFGCRLLLGRGNNHITHVERFEGFSGC